MSDRLTYTPPGKNEKWPQLVFPLMLLLTALAMIPAPRGVEFTPLHLPLGNIRFDLPVHSLALLLLLGQSGLLLRSLLPQKAPSSLKAFATVCGIGIPFIFLQGFLHFIQNPFYNFAGGALMVSSWIFKLYAKKDALIWTIASGLVAGLACSVSPVCLSGVLALFIFSFFQKGLAFKYKLFNLFIWILALLCGLIPALNGSIPFPIYETRVFEPDFVKGGLQLIFQNTPVWAWFFTFIGLGVALLQKQAIILGLILPFLLFRLVLSGFQPLKYWGVDATLLLPFAWLTAYGMLRVIRGFEQGVRKVNRKQAAKIPAIATGVFVLGFLIRIADLFYFFS